MVRGDDRETTKAARGGGLFCFNLAGSSGPLFQAGDFFLELQFLLLHARDFEVVAPRRALGGLNGFGQLVMLSLELLKM
jgi:hypothetical protein